MEKPPVSANGKRGWTELIASLLFVLAACAAIITGRTPHGGIAPAATATAKPAQIEAALSLTALPTMPPQSTAIDIPSSPTAVPPKAALTSSPLPSATATGLLPPERWKEWPVIPIISPAMVSIYQDGLLTGNNPRAFSILGDCQSLPEVFLAPYDTDSNLFFSLDPDMQETVLQFNGMFSRVSPTIKDGTTEGSLLWSEWNDNPEGLCSQGETPLDCELRTNRPGIVFIHVGTHWEARSQRYFTTIIEKILAARAIPVLVTKADNREKDERINSAYAQLAAEYGIPLWNFWASVQGLPNYGLRPDSDMYLSDEAVVIHRTDALIVLDTIWRAVR